MRSGDLFARYGMSNKADTFSPDLRELVTDLENVCSGLRELILRELGAGQGRAEPRDFLDPRPLLGPPTHCDRNCESTHCRTSLSEGGWKKRFYEAVLPNIYQELPLRVGD